MGKKKNQSKLGKSIIRSRFGKNVNKSGESFLHTSELSDGYDWGRLNLQSVTEQSNLDEFLATAELAGTEFTAEKLNVSFVDPGKNSGILSKDELKDVKDAQEKHKQLLRIPRRPAWDEMTSPEELDALERHTFLNWRRVLAELQEVKNIHLTPYEKNLEFWRQLWRVIERSDVIVQIVDARNPLLFRCADLETYVKETSPNKVNLVLINKADYLSEKQRMSWADYFKKEGVLVAFWSALEESNKQVDCEETGEDEVNEASMDEDSEEDEDSEICNIETNSVPDDDVVNVNESVNNNNAVSAGTMDTESQSSTVTDNIQSKDSEDVCVQTVPSDKNISSQSCDNEELGCDDLNNDSTQAGTCTVADVKTQNCSSKVLSGEELLELFRSLHTSRDEDKPHTTVGMVGYPNVGKSSTINAILKMKKVPVSATPGRTKHFQTLIVDDDLMLCDCPGLVFPSFVTTKADLVVNGILPIDQMRDHVPPVSLVCHRIPRFLLESLYGINIPKPGECEDDVRPPTAPELLNSHGFMRGFMTSRGVPDNPRSSRYILKDYVNGKLLYCNPPPGVDQEEFRNLGHHAHLTERDVEQSHDQIDECRVKEAIVPESSIDQEFFRQKNSQIHSKGVHGVSGFVRANTSGEHVPSGSGAAGLTGSGFSLTGKPWKKHNNRKKKEKVRRIHGYLDE